MRRRIVGPVLFLSFIGILCLASLGGAYDRIANLAVTITILSVVVTGSIYKMILFLRYRHDPHRRESLVSSAQLYPEKVKRWLTDDYSDNSRKR